MWCVFDGLLDSVVNRAAYQALQLSKLIRTGKIQKNYAWVTVLLELGHILENKIIKFSVMNENTSCWVYGIFNIYLQHFAMKWPFNIFNMYIAFHFFYFSFIFFRTLFWQFCLRLAINTDAFTGINESVRRYGGCTMCVCTLYNPKRHLNIHASIHVLNCDVFVFHQTTNSLSTSPWYFILILAIIHPAPRHLLLVLPQAVVLHFFPLYLAVSVLFRDPTLLFSF